LSIKVFFSPILKPQRTLKNNLGASGIDYKKIDEKTLKLRAQQMNVLQLLEVFNIIYQEIRD